MSLRLNLVAQRAYDAMKRRPGANPRESDARDTGTLAAVSTRLQELIVAYKINSQNDRGITYLFWSEVSGQIDAGAFDDLLDRL